MPRHSRTVPSLIPCTAPAVVCTVSGSEAPAGAGRPTTVRAHMEAARADQATGARLNLFICPPFEARHGAELHHDSRPRKSDHPAVRAPPVASTGILLSCQVTVKAE